MEPLPTRGWRSESDAWHQQTAASTPEVLFSESQNNVFIGRWVDPASNFFGGSIIEITDTSWRPLHLKDKIHANAVFSRGFCNNAMWRLIEKRQDGTERTFEAWPGVNDSLQVRVAGTGLEWTLLRDVPQPAPLRKLFLRYPDPADELLHAAEMDERARPIFFAVCAGLGGISTVELCWSGAIEHLSVEDPVARTTAWSRLCLLLLLVLTLTAVRAGWLFSDFSASLGICLGSILLECTSDARMAAFLGVDVISPAGQYIKLEEDVWECPRVLSVALLLCALHLLLEVRTSRSWPAPVFSVASFIYIGRNGEPTVDSLLTALLLAILGSLCWCRRWIDERKERGQWSHQHKQQMRNQAYEDALQRRREIEDAYEMLKEVAGGDFQPSMMAVSSKRSDESLSAVRAPSLPRKRVERSKSAPARQQVVTESLEELARKRWLLEEGRALTENVDPPEVPVPVIKPPFLAEEAASRTVPNDLLRASMQHKQCDVERVYTMARLIGEPSYTLFHFFEDALHAFPELGLFFVTDSTSSGRSARVEYQRTIGALFAVYWLIRLDGDGKKSFCFGVDDNWQVCRPRLTIGEQQDQVPLSKMSDEQKRQTFYASMDWSKFSELVSAALQGPNGQHDLDRVAAMLCLTAFHDIMKVPDLCPVVQDEHAPYMGYDTDEVINDHDIALAYVLENYPWLLPSYDALPVGAQKVILFSQAKMQFNHGWFVQAEAPPGAMLVTFRQVLLQMAASSADLAFYFLHWFTDLSGAQGQPLAGAEKFVTKFPHSVLQMFIWSIPYIEQLELKSETEVFEDYLRARWKAVFPRRPVPSGREAVALLRLAVMAQDGATRAVQCFQALPRMKRALFAAELARTGIPEQQYASSYVTGGPAFLVYYGPALLQGCQGDVRRMQLALTALAAVYQAGRVLWPSNASHEGETVTLEIGQLKSVDIESVFTPALGEVRGMWTLVQRNSREACCQLQSPAELNSLSNEGVRFCLLELNSMNEAPLELVIATRTSPGGTPSPTSPTGASSSAQFNALRLPLLAQDPRGVENHHSMPSRHLTEGALTLPANPYVARSFA